MTGPKQRLDDLRARWPVVDHAVRTQEHYGAVEAGQQAGAVTYFGFLSVFPILALAVFAVSWLARIYADAEETLANAINQIMPGLVGPGEGQISVEDVQRFTGLAGILGLIGVLYAGLGWLRATRRSLQVVFGIPPQDRPGFLSANLRDLVGLVAIGTTLFLSVIVASAITGFSADVVDYLGLGGGTAWILDALTRLISWAIDTVLFFLLFRLVGRPPVPDRSLWGAAVLGGAAFEVLKAISVVLLQLVQGNPAFTAFGAALILLVWINYFAKVVLYAAAWAHTSSAARAARAAADVAPPVQGPQTPALSLAGPGVAQASSEGRRTVPAGSFLAGAATMVAALGLLKKVGRK
ncbi:inner membrane protein YhjD [Nocardioides panacihumi]|uniref:Inner membrane protein YhjD n=1 Tax=Nocardioides panacihumi TaxID=400774 RepID=A0ABP5CL55_9ACTN